MATLERNTENPTLIGELKTSNKDLTNCNLNEKEIKKGSTSFWQLLFGERKCKYCLLRKSDCFCKDKKKRDAKHLQTEGYVKGKCHDKIRMSESLSSRVSQPKCAFPLVKKGCGCHLYFCIDSKKNNIQVRNKKHKCVKRSNEKIDDIFYPKQCLYSGFLCGNLSQDINAKSTIQKNDFPYTNLSNVGNATKAKTLAKVNAVPTSADSAKIDAQANTNTQAKIDTIVKADSLELAETPSKIKIQAKTRALRKVDTKAKTDNIVKADSLELAETPSKIKIQAKTCALTKVDTKAKTDNIVEADSLSEIDTLNADALAPKVATKFSSDQFTTNHFKNSDTKKNLENNCKAHLIRKSVKNLSDKNNLKNQNDILTKTNNTNYVLCNNKKETEAFVNMETHKKLTTNSLEPKTRQLNKMYSVHSNMATNTFHNISSIDLQNQTILPSYEEKTKPTELGDSQKTIKREKKESSFKQDVSNGSAAPSKPKSDTNNSDEEKLCRKNIIKESDDENDLMNFRWKKSQRRLTGRRGLVKNSLISIRRQQRQYQVDDMINTILVKLDHIEDKIVSLENTCINKDKQVSMGICGENNQSKMCNKFNNTDNYIQNRHSLERQQIPSKKSIKTLSIKSLDENIFITVSKDVKPTIKMKSTDIDAHNIISLCNQPDVIVYNNSKTLSENGKNKKSGYSPKICDKWRRVSEELKISEQEAEELICCSE